MKFFALIAAVSAHKLVQQPLADYRIEKLPFTADAKTHFNTGSDPSCPSYLSGYSCHSWWTGKGTAALTGLQGQAGGFRDHTTVHPTS